MTRRADAANLVSHILRDLGALSAIVPRGPLLDLVDDETGHMAALAEAIGRDMPTAGGTPGSREDAGT